MSVKDNSCGIADLQDKMLDIFKYFKELCEENDLTYWLAGGTTIGALRHGGFIPWDDDFDVYMPRPDYEQLWKLYRKGCPDSKFRLCRTGRTKNYHHRVMQIVDLTTTFINERSKDEDIEHGIYIDIIPMDIRAKSTFGRMAQFCNTVLFSIFNIQCKQEFNGGKLTKIVNFVAAIMLGVIRSSKVRYHIWRLAQRGMVRHAWDDHSERIVLISTMHELFTPFPAEWFGQRIVRFEDTDAVVPSEAEKYCTAMYGNYMELPPKSEQTVKHHTVFIDLKKSYTEYKGIYYCKRKKKNMPT